MGFLPRFVDGHQHVHQFPIVRDAIMNVYELRLRQRHGFIRMTNPSWRFSDFIFNFKKIVIALTGSAWLQQELKLKGVPHNSSFSGIYSFSPKADYRKYFQRFLAEVQDGGMIMCHPALASSSVKDSIASARFNEYKYFTSELFLADCAANKVVLDRLR